MFARSGFATLCKSADFSEISYSAFPTCKGLLQKSDELMELHVLIKYQVLLTMFDLLILSEHQIIC